MNDQIKGKRNQNDFDDFEIAYFETFFKEEYFCYK